MVNHRRDWKTAIMNEIDDMRAKNSLPTTERHLMYRLESKGFLNKKSDSDMNYLSDRVTEYRERGLIKNEEIIDASREIVGEEDYGHGTPSEFLTGLLKEDIENSSDYYMKSRWEGQTFFPIFIVEKEALARIFIDTLKDYRVKIVPSRGNCSYPQMLELIKIVKDFPKITRIFLFSDCDYAGYSDKDDIVNRIQRYSDKIPIVERVALTEDQVLNVYHLPWIPPNPKDKNAKKYPLKVATELDAMETKDLRDLIIQSVESCITNRQAWNTAISREKWGKRQLQYFSKKVRVYIGKEKVYP